MSPRHALLAVLVMLVWGGNFVVIDAGLADVPPLAFLALRFALVALPWVFVVPPPRVGWRPVVAVGAFMSLGQFSFLYVALELGMPAGLASLVLQAQVIITIVLAAAVLRERPTRAQAVGATVGTVGLVVVMVAHGASSPLLPAVVMLGASTCWAIGNVVARAAGVASGLSMVVWSALVVPVPAFLLSVLVDGWSPTVDGLTQLSGTAWLSTAYTAFGASLLGYTIWNSLLARYPASAVVPFVLLVPVVGIVAAWLVQGEVPSPLELAGGAVMMVGVALATVRLGRRSRAGVTRDPAPACADASPRAGRAPARARR